MWRRAAVFLLVSVCAWAEKPSLEAIHPAGLSLGETNAITLFGKFDPWPPRVWTSGGGLNFSFSTNKGKASVVVDADALPGPRLVRLYNADGASELRLLAVNPQAEQIEKEPNDHYSKSTSVEHLPVSFSGHLEKRGDVDSYLLKLRAGEWLDARVESHTLMSKVDPVLRLLTTNGFQIAWNHDFDSFDPRLVWLSPKDQNVVLQVFGFVYPANAEIQLTGGAGGIYRLHLSTARTNPLAVPAPQHASVTLSGEPVDGLICGPANTVQHKLALKKDAWIEATVAAARIGSKLDPWVSFSDSAGKELARNDDSEGTRDARLEWRVPADGEYLCTVGSITRRGGDQHRYRLHVRELAPDYHASVEQSDWTLKPGETNQVKVKVKRLRGFTNELKIAFATLPEGVSSDGPKVDSNGGDLNIALIAATNAPAWNGVVHLTAADTTTSEAHPVEFELVSRSENNGVPGGYSKLLIEKTDALWLTVLKTPEPIKKSE